MFGDSDCTNADTYPEAKAFRLMVPGAANCDMEPALVTLAPGEALREKSHAGEEFGYLLQGKVMILYGKRQSPARKGEWFYFVADRAHGISNPFDHTAKVLWVSTPPSF